MSNKAVLCGEQLCKSYGKRPVLHDVSIEVRGGEVVGLLGPNGAGKTTTFSIIVGILRPDKGNVRYNGEDITNLPMHMRARKGITYLPQEPSVFRKLTVEENVMAVLETLDLTAAERRMRLGQLLRELHITHLAPQRAESLSGGERRRVEITRALVMSPSFMLLDEPFAGIDPLSVNDIQEIIAQLRSRGIGILITDHNAQETLRICDRAYLLTDGTVFLSGTPEELAANEQARQAYLGQRFSLQSRG
ncbi:MAG: LPS export ABC transporter ATP-binding protein [Deltaproteobacteria bacterium]|nr:LPS export ABC transporter ATP-binding protein [Deltaproteobacteria bacterium]